MLMMPKLIFFILFLASSQLGASNFNTTIRGKVPGAESRVIRLYAFQNLISTTPIKIAQDTIRPNSEFRFNLNLNKAEVKVVYFAVEKYNSFDLFLEEGKSYFLEFGELDYINQDQLYSPFSITSPVLEFRLPKNENELNQQIWRLTNEIIYFSEEHILEIAQTRNPYKIEIFKNRIDSIFKVDKRSKYFNDFIEYAIADIEYNSGVYNRKYFVDKYLNNRPFLYNHPAFMTFFNSFFDKYINMHNIRLFLKDLQDNIGKETNYLALLDSLGKDPLLVNIVVRDMVLIKNVHQMYYDNLFSKKALTDFMEAINHKSRYKEHKEIASQLKGEFLREQLHNYKPSLQLKQADGFYIDLEDYRGVYTYLLFFTTSCLPCVMEFNALNNLYPKLKDEVNFIGVSMDVSFLNFFYFMKENSYPWHFGNFNKDFDIEDQWRVKLYPHAILLDKNGFIVNENAPLPTEMLEAYLFKLLNKI